MIRSADLRSMNQKLGPVGRTSIALLVVAVIAFGSSLRGFASAFFAPSARQVKSSQDEKLKQLAADYSKFVEGQVAQFNGRSVFFIPSAPVPKVVEPPKPIAVENPKPVEPPKPAVYGGPKLIAMVNDGAWFADGQKLDVGAEGKDGLKLKELRVPWEVSVVWKGVDFNVSLFDRDKVVYPANPPEKPKEAEGEAKAGETKPAEGGDKPETPKTESPKTEPGATGTPEPKPDAPKPDAPKPDSPKPEPKPEEPKPEAPKPAEPNAEDPKPAPAPAPPKPDGQ